MLAANSRYNAREWVTMAGALVVQLSALNAKRQKGESKPRRPLWKHFAADDADSTAHQDQAASRRWWAPMAEPTVPLTVRDHYMAHGRVVF